MKVAIEGCCHGEIETIYNSLVHIENTTNTKIDLLICCGDYEAIRNQHDLLSLAVPDKYRALGCFHHYYSGRLVAPILTLVIGGNHESSSYFSELENGGWLCHNIYYMGRASVVSVGGLRIAGVSGIYKDHDYQKGHFEQQPLNSSTMRSIYHIREIDVLKMLDIASLPSTQRIDIAFSHDWPQGIINYGDKQRLYRMKKHLAQDGDLLGSPPNMQILKTLCPRYWFSAHLHVKWGAVYPHPNGPTTETSEPKTTKFLALDKVLPDRDFLQILDIDPSTTTTTTTTSQQSSPSSSPKLVYDAQWLCILNKTKLITANHNNHFPTPLDKNSFKKLCTKEEIEHIKLRFKTIYKLKNQLDDGVDLSTIKDEDAMEISQSNFVANTLAFDPSNPNNPLPFLAPRFPNPQPIVLSHLIAIVCGNDPIDASTLSKLNVETFSQSNLISTINNNNNNNNNNINNNNNNNADEETSQATKMQRISMDQTSKKFKDESEIDLDDL
ncbi:Debranching enzyme [Cavenderia fasciculata]|uniref:Debranching enzyme n=1 Tax=Cavenderia fasciculata TaxID=261658 RepID=F4PXW5_CACFS|nr:Debranching enzyme [Cavenderia fasciculata]EGG19625.1 Debranching enzyme [Cavenderia fasciculata]|eukprot:XP_004357919.1 Debranching enzyme [Cavenderia fasciculata]